MGIGVSPSDGRQGRSPPPPSNLLRSNFFTRLFLSLKMAQIRRDIQDFKSSSGVDKVIVLWTANTERFCDVQAGLNDTADHLLQAIEVRTHFTFLHAVVVGFSSLPHFFVF